MLPPPRIAFLGRWTGGTDALAAGFHAAWPHPTSPRILGVESLEDAPAFLDLVDGFLLLHGDCLPLMDSLRATGKPIVGRSVEYEPLGIPIAPTADEEAGRRAGTLLAATCPGELLYLGLPKTFSRRRWSGFAEACHAAHRPAHDLDLETTDLKTLLPSLPVGSGVFAFNDETAYATAAIARKLGLAIPDHISLVGIDNAPLPPDASPVSTMAFDPREQGLAMGRLLRAQLEMKTPPLRTDILPGPLIPRTTTR